MIKEKYKIIFFGTPNFATIILDSMIKNNWKPIAVITEPDKPAGRKRILTPPPIKNLAEKYNITILQPKNLTAITDKLSLLKPDLFIVAAYGKILPRETLDIPKFGSLNIHPSLLPKYRGASPIQATILNGDKETGITIILMDEKIDHGPIIAQKKLEFPLGKITYQKLTEKLAKLGAELLIEILPKWLNKKIKPIEQNHLKATYTKKIKKEDGRINWSKSAKEIERMTRAYLPWPSAYTKVKDKILKIINSEVLKIKHNKQPGTVFLTKDKKLAVACGRNILILKKIQLEGKRAMKAKDFLNGHPEIINTTLI